MQLSPLYLERIHEAELIGEQRGEQRGYQEIVLRLLRKRLGHVSMEMEVRVKGLSLVLLEELAEALLDFTGMADLEVWLAASEQI
jgi:Domain of unknown function (DUF4351)